MNTLRLSGPVLDLDGVAIPNNVTLANVLAGALIASTSGPAIKYLDWAIDLKLKGEISVDNADRDAIKAFVEGNAQLTNLAKGRLLKAINEPDSPTCIPATP